jgi:hypothetical protein
MKIGLFQHLLFNLNYSLSLSNMIAHNLLIILINTDKSNSIL